jgi:hypothetical protein
MGVDVSRSPFQFIVELGICPKSTWQRGEALFQMEIMYTRFTLDGSKLRIYQKEIILLSRLPQRIPRNLPLFGIRSSYRQPFSHHDSEILEEEFRKRGEPSSSGIVLPVEYDGLFEVNLVTMEFTPSTPS